jgi:hypothetical protein
MDREADERPPTDYRRQSTSVPLRYTSPRGVGRQVAGSGSGCQLDAPAYGDHEFEGALGWVTFWRSPPFAPRVTIRLPQAST